MKFIWWPLYAENGFVSQGGTPGQVNVLPAMRWPAATVCGSWDWNNLKAMAQLYVNFLLLCKRRMNKCCEYEEYKSADGKGYTIFIQ